MAAGDPLVTLAEVRAHLMIKTTETGRDALITSMLNRASRTIQRYTEREFIPTATNPVTRDFRYEGGGILSLAPHDLRAVTSITIDVDGATPSPTTLTADDYRLLPMPSPDAVYSSIELRGLSPAGSSSAHDYQPSRVVRIVGTWGWVDTTAAVPEDIKMATILTIAAWLRHFSNPTSAMYNQELDTNTEGRFALPFAAKQLLAVYRRRHA